MVVLRATRGMEVGRQFELTDGTVLLGRNPKRCQVVLNHYAVSREHARVDLIDSVPFIEDLHSRNGVIVNGRQLAPGPAGRQRLYPSDRIEIATFEFVYEDQSTDRDLVYLSAESSKHNILSTIEVSDDSSGASSRIRRGKLNTLVSIIEQLSRELDFEKVLPRIVGSLMTAFPQAHQGCVLLRNSLGELKPVAVQSRNPGAGPIQVSRAVLDEVIEKRQVVLANAAMTGSSSKGTGTGSITHSAPWAMCAPLVDRLREVVGIVQLETNDGQDCFTPDDLEILGAVARHLAVVFENAQWHASALNAQRVIYENRFRMLVEGSLQGILIHRDFRPLFVNEAYAALHDYSVAEIMAMNSVLPLIAPSQQDLSLQRAAARMQKLHTPSRYESQHVKRDGTLFWVEKFVTMIEWDGQPAIQSALIDLSQRKAAEQELQQARTNLERRVEERTKELADANRLLQTEVAERCNAENELRESEGLYHSLVDHIPLCVARKDLDGKFTFVNKSLCELLRMTPAEVIGRTDYEVFPAPWAEAYHATDLRVAQTGELADLLETLRLADGRELKIHTIKTPIYDSAQQIIGTQLLFWDITKQTRTEEERNRYAAELERSNSDLEQFAYSVSHDLQAPLRTIASYCQLLHKRYAGSLDAEADEFLDGVVDGARRMKRLLDDLLRYSRVNTAAEQFGHTDCAAVLEDVRNNLKNQLDECGARLTSEPLPTIIGDRTLLLQLFQNLVLNAIVYRRDEPPQIHVGVVEQTDGWTFSVRDNGVGIEPRHFERIFQVFQRLYAQHERPGSGIGLSTCKRIVERHHGRIWVESVAGRGSVFYFTIPKLPCDSARDTA